MIEELYNFGSKIKRVSFRYKLKNQGFLVIFIILCLFCITSFQKMIEIDFENINFKSSKPDRIKKNLKTLKTA